MYFIEIALFTAGIVVLVVGYRRHHRNLLLAAAVVLFLAGALSSAVDGVIEGYQESRTRHST